MSALRTLRHIPQALVWARATLAEGLAREAFLLEVHLLGGDRDAAEAAALDAYRMGAAPSLEVARGRLLASLKGGRR